MSRALGQNSVTPWGNDMNFRLARDQTVLLEIAANLRKANDFMQFFLVLSWEVNKTSPREILRVSGKQNSLFPLEPVVKCLM